MMLGCSLGHDLCISAVNVLVCLLLGERLGMSGLSADEGWL